MNSTSFRLAMVAALLVGAWLRLPRLADRPMHGDEAIHAVRCEELWQTGRFEYDPSDYHGPTPYYFTLPLRALFPSATFAQTTELLYRLVPALFGLLMIPLLGLLRGGLAREGVAAAALLLAVSPAMVFYSRYYIQEMLLACFTLAAIGCGWRYMVTRRLGWATACGAALGLMHATKETCVLSFGAMGLALAVVSVQRRRSGATEGVQAGTADVARRRRLHSGRALFVGAATALLVSFACYSVFFTYARGPLDSILALWNYLDRSGGAGLHDHPWYWYLATLVYTHYRDAPVFSEAMILGLGAAGFFAAFSSGARASTEVESRQAVAARAQAEAIDFRRFLALYALILTVVYSAIPYKTPWCAVQFLLPVILLAGLAVDWAAARFRNLVSRTLIGTAFLAGVLNLATQSQRATSPRLMADHRNPYVYAHPVRKVVDLGRYVQSVCQAGPDDTATRVNVIMDDAWPLPWYLRGLTAVGYWESVEAAERDLLDHGGIAAPIVIATTKHEPALDRLLPASCHKSYYGLRPDVVCVVYVQESLRRAFVRKYSPSESRENP